VAYYRACVEPVLAIDGVDRSSTGTRVP
jgi:hypothetical protein